MNVAIALSIKRIDRDLKFVPKLIILLITAPFLLVSGCGFQSLQHEPDTIYSPVHIQASQVKYTGLVIDARGKGLKASLMPQILVRIGSGYQTVYGGGVCDAEAVVKYGVCGYKNTLNEAYRSTERIGAEPLTIRAVEAVGSKNQDVVVSREDADLIISAFKATGFEKQCKVIFVIDYHPISVKGSGAPNPDEKNIEKAKQGAFMAAFFDGIRNLAEEICRLKPVEDAETKNLISNTNARISDFEISSTTIVDPTTVQTIKDLILVKYKNRDFKVNDATLTSPFEMQTFPSYKKVPTKIGDIEIANLRWFNDGSAEVELSLLYDSRADYSCGQNTHTK